MEGLRVKIGERRKTDRQDDLEQELCKPQLDNNTTPFFIKTMAFTVERKIRKLDLATRGICSTQDSKYQLNALEVLSTMIMADYRLGDYMDSRVFPHLIKFLEVKENIPRLVDDNGKTKRNPEYKKNIRFQYCSAIVLRKTVSSKNGNEFKDLVIPYLVKLIPSPVMYVQLEALSALSNIANIFPDSCHDILKNNTLEVLESVLGNQQTHFNVLECGGELLVALCRMKPYLPPNKMDIVFRTITTAIAQDHHEVLTHVCTSLSILSNERLVPVGIQVYERLFELIEYPIQETVFWALVAIGNYVRWANCQQIQFMVKQDFLQLLGGFLNHKKLKLRKEACWIISNIIAVVNNLQMQEVIDACLIELLFELLKSFDFGAKELVAFALCNAICGSDEKQLKVIKEKCVDGLKVIQMMDGCVVATTLCSDIETSILYRESNLESSSEMFKQMTIKKKYP